MARDCPAAFVEPGDILEFTLDGNPAVDDNRPPCAERFPHAAIYAARPDVKSVLCAGSEGRAAVRHHADPLRAVLGTVGDMGTGVPVWDIAEKFGDETDLVVSDTGARTRSCAAARRHRSCCCRGVGFVATGRTLNDAVRSSVYIPKNARVLAQSLQFGTVSPISQGEINAAARDRSGS